MAATSVNSQQIKYPETKKVNQVDDYFGKKIEDPYRWLEDDKSAETAEWVKSENKVTTDYLSKISYRDKIKERLTKIWNFPKYTAPWKEGKYYFFYKNDGMQNQNVLYFQEGLKAEPKVLLDPNTMSKEGTSALSNISISHDAKYLAYAVSKGGSDWEEIFVQEIVSGKKLDDHIEWCKFTGIAWHKDGFYYSRYDAPNGSKLSVKNEYHKIYFHKIGTKQSDDKLIYENKNFPLHNYSAATTEDEHFLLMYESESTSGSALYVKDLTKANDEFKKIAEGFKFDYNVIDNIGDKLLIMTSEDAPKYEVMLVDPSKPEAKKIIIPAKEEVLQSITLVGGKIVALYMKDASSKAMVFDMDGKLLNEIVLPCPGTINAMNGRKDENIAFYDFTSFTFPTTTYTYNITKNTSEIYNKSAIDFNISDFETKQIFYTSKDGTKIPMFLVHKKGLKMDGQNPTLLYGYGGFNVSITPTFSVSRLILLENGFVLAVANIRGGGEYGEEWHKAGTKLKKQNVFDDFIGAAEYLIKEKYTSSPKLAIQGGSNGGLLIGACMTQRPELFKVALPQVGVMDMLRYHKFTIGWAWAGDYGSSDNKEEFDYLYKYSPIHNLKSGINYPATLVTTADHDDRVVPAHSFKFIATLQEKHKGVNPVLIRVETMAGHGAGKPTAKLIEELSDTWAFVFYNLGVTTKY